MYLPCVDEGGHEVQIKFLEIEHLINMHNLINAKWLSIYL